MSESASAQIIPFPARTEPAGAAAPVDVGKAEPGGAQARLARALAGLNDAVTAQRVAVAAWKSSLGELSAATGRLGASLRGYNDTLGRLDARVATLRDEAVKLEFWADDVIAHQG